MYNMYTVISSTESTCTYTHIAVPSDKTIKEVIKEMNITGVEFVFRGHITPVRNWY